MAVVAVWKCDRDGAMFDNKKDAEEHDKMLELAANISCLIERHVELDEEQSEAIGLLLATRRDKLMLACKGKPEALLTQDEVAQADKPTEPAVAPIETDEADSSPRDADKITSISAAV